MLKASLDNFIKWVSSLQTIVAYLGIKFVNAISPKLPSVSTYPTFIIPGYLLANISSSVLSQKSFSS